MRAILRQLALPLLLVGLLAALLGFLVMRSVIGDGAGARAEVSVVGIPATPSPTPTITPDTTASEGATAGSGRSGRSGGTPRDPRCPSGCECQFPRGGTVVVCRGNGSVTIP